VDGDTYVFLLGDSLSSWRESRKEFIDLTGPTPLLPDFAFGTWFTRWWHYTERLAKEEVLRWKHDRLPLDVWGLDLNWRNVTGTLEHFYDHPNRTAFKNLTAWFQFLREEQGLENYLSDHPYPVASRDKDAGLQTSVEEVTFRTHGLFEWLKRGATFWWFDANWEFSIPPPFVNSSQTFHSWKGLTNVAWGSHIYYKTLEVFRNCTGTSSSNSSTGGGGGDGAARRTCDDSNTRPVTLSKQASPDWRTDLDTSGAAESPAHHRYPVWWTGDWVDLMASVQSMVDAGLHHFKPYVHSDCGGNGPNHRDNRDHEYPGAAYDQVRWSAHCAFGSILRFHGDDHRPWSYPNSPGTSKNFRTQSNRTTNVAEDAIRRYLAARYRLMPSLIAAGQRATETSLPPVARGDFFWPEHADSARSDQYIFLQDILVAPMNTQCQERSNATCWASADGQLSRTNRTVWLPPGQWEDAWRGSVVTGPKVLTVMLQKFDEMPMWIQRSNGGSLLVLCDDPHALRVAAQDWSRLTLEAFPDFAPRSTNAGPATIQRSLFERGTAERTEISMITRMRGSMRRSSATVHVSIEPPPSTTGGAGARAARSRSWLVRVHLLPGQRVVAASRNGAWVDAAAAVRIIEPVDANSTSSSIFFPLGGIGAAPPAAAGSVAEILVLPSPYHNGDSLPRVRAELELEVVSTAGEEYSSLT
jgi:hypothetical protein